MVGGLARGLSHRDAARFSFLLATPVILAAGLFKMPDSTWYPSARASLAKCSPAASPHSSPHT